MKINGKEYKIPEITFNVVCDLEDLGISLAEFQKKPIGAIRGFVALAMKGDLEQAGKELEQHIINGGNFEEITKEVGDAIQESDFFRSLQEGQKAKATKGTKQAK